MEGKKEREGCKGKEEGGKGRGRGKEGRRESASINNLATSATLKCKIK